MIDTNKPEYLLNDDEFVALMEREFQANGSPQNDIVKQKIWNRLQKKPVKRWSAAISGLVVAAAAMFMLNQPKHAPDMKSGTGAIEMKLRWESGSAGEMPRRLRVISPVAGIFALYGGSETGQPRRLTAPQTVDVERTVALDAAQLEGIQRVCVIAGGDAQELQNLEDMMNLIWPRLEDNFCVAVQ